MLPRLFARTIEVSAHCDLPCGVYDPAQARIEAESVKAIIEKCARQRRPRLPHPRGPDQGAALRAGQAPPLGAVDRLLQAAALREVPAAAPARSTRRPSWRAPPAPRARSTSPRPTSCSARSTRSPRSSGRRSRHDHQRRGRPVRRRAAAAGGPRLRLCAADADRRARGAPGLHDGRHRGPADRRQRDDRDGARRGRCRRRPGLPLPAASRASSGSRSAPTVGSPTRPDFDSFGWQVLTTLTTAAGVDASPGHFAVHITVRSSLDPSALDGAGL